MSGSLAPRARRGVPLPSVTGGLAAARASLRAPEAIAAGVTVAAITLLVIVGPTGAADGPGHIAAAVLGLAGLLVGSVLVVRASRDYFLGLGGVVVCAFLALLLAIYAGLVLNLSSSRARPTASLVYQAGVARPSALLAMGGLVAAALIAASPWAPYRARLQPALIAAAVVLPSLGLIVLPRTGFALPADIVETMLGRDDPLLILALTAVALAIPAQAVGAVGWIYAWSAGAVRLRGFAARPAMQLAVLATFTAWMVLGISGRLPAALGRGLSEWHSLRDLPPSEWVVAVAVAVGAACLLQLWHGLLEPADAASMGYALALAFATIVATTLGICLLAVVGLLAISAEPPAAVRAVVGLGAAVALATAATWSALSGGTAPGGTAPGGWASGFTGRGRTALTAALVAAALGLLVACTAGWPGGRAAVLFSYASARPDVNFFVTFADSNGLAAFTLLALPLVSLLVIRFYVWALRAAAGGRDWRRGPEYGYIALTVPLLAWMLLGGCLLVLPTIRRPLGDAFTSLHLPDPAAVVFAASIPVLVLGVARLVSGRYGDTDRRLVRAALVLAALSFVPFVVPAVLRSGGRLALAGLVVQLIFTLAVLVTRHMPAATRKRNITWQLGLSTVSIPLLAYAAVSAGRGSLFLASGVIGDLGRSGGLGVLAQSRLIWTLPLTIAFAAADRPPARRPGGGSKQTAWRDFECDWLVSEVDGETFGQTLENSFGKHVRAMDPLQRRAYALQLARWLLARCRFHASHPSEPGAGGLGRGRAGGYRAGGDGPSREEVHDALDTAARALAGPVSPGERQTAIATAQSLQAGEVAPVRTHRLPFRRCLGSALCYALGDGTEDPAVLIEAVGTEISAAARDYLARQDEYGEAYDLAVWKYRHSVGRLIGALPGNFTLVKDASGFGLTPSIVLDTPPRREWGLAQPRQHPYARLAAIFGGFVIVLVMIALAATLFDSLLNAVGVCAHMECVLH